MRRKEENLNIINDKMATKWELKKHRVILIKTQMKTKCSIDTITYILTVALKIHVHRYICQNQFRPLQCAEFKAD